MRTVQPVHIAVTLARHLEHVASLAAAKVKDARFLIDLQQVEKHADLGARNIIVVDDVAVGAQVVGVENFPPPVSLDVALEIFDGAEDFDQALIVALATTVGRNWFVHTNLNPDVAITKASNVRSDRLPGVTSGQHLLNSSLARIEAEAPARHQTGWLVGSANIAL